MNLENLYYQASELAGRAVEVAKTTDGKHIVLFMVFGESPPPKGDTEELALQAFIDWAKARPVKDLPELDLISEDDEDF